MPINLIMKINQNLYFKIIILPLENHKSPTCSMLCLIHEMASSCRGESSLEKVEGDVAVGVRLVPTLDLGR